MEQEKVPETGSTLSGKIKAKWGKLTDLDISDAEKNMDSLSAKIQKAYGRNKDSVDDEISEFRKLHAVEATPATSTN